MHPVVLNLTRKWRAKTFDQIIGQQLPVTMIKNSLYLNYFFPVYLFSGQRGCGKTSAARLLAMAVNCAALEEFQQHPRTISLPCLTCTSCQIFQEGKHPDFIEIDAASHTGVDNIRTIIDACSFLPILGSKKIYLIDEAHMLSKPAFNALLKILEEPPVSTIFILATTDPHKIIDTVRSRCFQILFKPVSEDHLCKHLHDICATEKIPADVSGLREIVLHSDGSVRDAINLLEQVRFSNSRITQNAVLAQLGYIPQTIIITVLDHLFTRSAHELATYIHSVAWQEYAAETIWNRLISAVRMLIWIEHGIDHPELSGYKTELQQLLHKIGITPVLQLLDIIYAFDQRVRKTTLGHTMLELFFFEAHKQLGPSTNDSNSTPVPASAIPAVAALEQDNECIEDDLSQDQSDNENDEDTSHVDIIDDAEIVLRWKQIIQEIEKKQEPLIASIFQNGTQITYDREHQTISVLFSKDFSFFEGLLEETASIWEPIFHKIVNAPVRLCPSFTGPSIEKAKVVRVVPENNPASSQTKPSVRTIPTQKIYNKPKDTRRRVHKEHERPIDVSQKEKWPIATLLLQHFPGTIVELMES